MAEGTRFVVEISPKHLLVFSALGTGARRATELAKITTIEIRGVEER